MWPTQRTAMSRRVRLWAGAAGVAVAAAACGSGQATLQQASVPNAAANATAVPPPGGGAPGGSVAGPGPGLPQVSAAVPPAAHPAPGQPAPAARAGVVPPPPVPGAAVPGGTRGYFASDVGVTKDTITIGIINYASATRGLGPPIALATQRMTAAMVQWINETGGISGRRLNLVTCDDGGDVTRARACYEKLRTEVFAMVPSETWVTDTIHDRLDADRLPWMTYGWFASEYQDPYMFPCHANGLRESTNVAKWLATQKHPHTVGILYLNDPEDIAARDAVTTLLSHYGVRVVAAIAQEWDSTDESQHTLAMRVANPDAILALTWPTPLAKFMREADAERWAPPLGFYGKHLVADPGYGPLLGDYIKDRLYSIDSWIQAGGLGQSPADDALPGEQLWRFLTNRYTGREFMNFHFKQVWGHHITQSAIVCTKILADVLRPMGADVTRARLVQALESQSFESGMGQVLRWPHGDHGREPYSFNREYMYLWVNAPDGTYDVRRQYPDPVNVE
jgi:ABC-type branched-subunit amino acid transport system substrate-binding protein